MRQLPAPRSWLSATPQAASFQPPGARFSLVCAAAAFLALTGCGPELPTASALSLGQQDFQDEDPLPAGPQSAAPMPEAEPAPSSDSPIPSLPIGDPFAGEEWQDIITKTRFTPQLNYSFDPPRSSASPETQIEMYQTKGEIEVKEVRFLLQGARFRFDRLSKDAIIGDGRLDVGTPPKLSIPAQVTITDTDRTSYAVAKVEANSLLASVYVADLRIKQLGNNLSIVSVSNFARGNNRHGQFTTEASARVVQRLYAGYLLLPDASAMEVRALIYSEPDAENDKREALRVHRQAVTLAPFNLSFATSR